LPAPAPEAALRRHDLVRPQPRAWAELLAGCWVEIRAGRADLIDVHWFAAWAERGWPLVVRRRAPDDPPDLIALGLPLPPSAGRRRIALSLAAEVLSEPQPPPRLAETAESAPGAWRATLARLTALDADVRVFGSLAWQALTGLDHLGPASDLDLLWPLPPAGAVEALLADIAAVAADAPVRLDGELVRADGAAASWRELASGCGEVLVKRLDGVGLETRSRFLGGSA
jgi:phosphoribosyl-dephospho-CoA transferase